MTDASGWAPNYKQALLLFTNVATTALNHT